MKKPRLENQFFSISGIVILVNHALLGISYYLQNNTQAWDAAIHISEVSLLIIILCLILRIVFIIAKKINLLEFLIGSFFNLMAFYFCLIVISDRI